MVGTVDREKLDDVTKKCVDLQIAHFGQCPNQVWFSLCFIVLVRLTPIVTVCYDVGSYSVDRILRSASALHQFLGR